MKKLQFLIASQNFQEAYNHSCLQTTAGFTKSLNERDYEIQKNIKDMSIKQLLALRQHTYTKLCQERRRCSARSKSYDISNHIRLYLMHKQLAQFI